MPIKKAAMKALKADKKKHDKNLATRSKLRTLRKSAITKINTKDVSGAEASLKELSSAYNKAANKKIVRKKTASRKISRMAKKVSKLTKS